MQETKLNRRTRHRNQWRSQEFYRACAKIIEPEILVRARVKILSLPNFFLILSGFMGYCVRQNIKKISIEPGRVFGLAGWWFRP